jgi:predicted RNase H-like nuclease
MFVAAACGSPGATGPVRETPMRFIGVDLAWGTRRTTGLCALDEDGTVLGSARVRTDAEIDEWVAPHVRDDAVVGIDAPVVVTNPTGRRRCEALLSSAFASRQAGCYPSNRANPNFADGGRAFHLGRRHGLSNDPHFAPRSPVRRILEVYPHSALVCLFGLPVTLKYKRRQGRSAPERQAVFERLCDLVQRFDGAEPAMAVGRSVDWARLRVEVAAARSGADLDRVEDEIDAYVCAYVALYYWWWGTEQCAVIGDAAAGAIVTPVDDEARRRLAALGSIEVEPPGSMG